MNHIKPQNWGGTAAFIAMFVLPIPVFGLICFFLFGWVFAAERIIESQKLRLRQCIDHSILSAAYDRLIADGQIHLNSSGLGSVPEDELPPEIRVLRPNYVYFDTKAMYLEFGGGFHHFGIKIRRSSVTNQPSAEDEEVCINERCFIYDHGG